MWSAPLFQLLPDQLWPGVVAPDRVLSMSQIELLICVKKKRPQARLNYYLQNVLTNHIYWIYMYKEELALNNLQWLICHNPTKLDYIYLIYMYKEGLALNNL